MKVQSKLLNLFDKTYIINLPERLDRRKDMEFELKRLGGLKALEKVCFFPAIKPNDKGDFPSIGARGCVMSHLEVLRDAKQQNLERILIMEDDLSFSRFLLDQENLVVKQLQDTNWDFAYLGHQIDSILMEKPDLNKIFQSYSQGIRLTHFFAINNMTILLLVDFLEAILQRPAGSPEGGPMYIDGAYSTFRQKNPQIRTIVANPNLGFQRSSSSNIYEKNSWFEKSTITIPLVNLFRKLKNWYKRNYQ